MQEFYVRLAATQKPTSADDAIEQLRRVLDEVEDEISGVVAVDPPPADGGGRMYFPLADQIVRRGDGGITAQTRGHEIVVQASGEVTITRRGTGEVEFQR